MRFTEDTPVTGDDGVVARLVFTACGQEKLLPTLVDTEVAAGETAELETLGCDGAVWVRTDDLERRSYVVTIERR